MTKFKNPITLILLIIFSIFLSFSCTSDNSINGSPDKYLSKPGEYESTNTKPEEYSTAEQCLFLYYHFNPFAGLLDDFEPPEGLEKPYDFKNNFLNNSEKGQTYTVAYYEISKYAIKNNLVNQYFKEHHKLLQASSKISFELLHGDDNTKILIQDDISNSLKEMLKIYREHSNHRDIDNVLDYLEADLEKYYNKPKIEISQDFEGN